MRAVLSPWSWEEIGSKMAPPPTAGLSTPDYSEEGFEPRQWTEKCDTMAIIFTWYQMSTVLKDPVKCDKYGS